VWHSSFGRAIHCSLLYIHVLTQKHVKKIVNVMSKISGKTRHEAFQEWHKWASHRYASMRVKKQKPIAPTYISYGGNDN
jgi:hypothetical protein